MDDERVVSLVRGMNFFELWYEDVHSTPELAGLSQAERNRHFISPKTWLQLRTTTTGLIRFMHNRFEQKCAVSLCAISQSPLEGQFSMARGHMHGTGKLTQQNLLTTLGYARYTNMDTVNRRHGQKRAAELLDTEGTVYMEQSPLADKRKRKREVVSKKKPEVAR